MTLTRHIIALGGGGFSMEPDNPLLDDYTLSLIPHSKKPKVCFIPTASGDAISYCTKFLSAFEPKRANASILTLFSRKIADITDFLCSQDVIYVGGGSTANLLAIWRLHGVDEAITQAYRNGVILTGISAGMNCWFEGSVTDSFGDYSGLNDGLALVPGSACPHYDGEPERKAVYHEEVAQGLPPGFAVYDSTALHFANEQLHDAISSKTCGKVFRVFRENAEVHEEEISVNFLGK